MRIRLLLLLVLLGVLLPTQLEAAPSGAPDATVTAASLNGSITEFSDCNGTITVQANSASLAVIRSGSTAQPLTVNVSYGGTLVPGTDYPAQPSAVTIDAGTDRAFLFVNASAPGTLTLSVAPGTGYGAGDPATTTAQITSNGFQTECPPAQEQTITLGETPTAVDVYGRFGGALADTVVDIAGDVPPGLTFNNDGSFTGSATQLGTFSFTASYCLAQFCGLVLPVTINVVPVDSTVPTTVTAPPGTPATPAAPAAPVRGQSSFTG